MPQLKYSSLFRLVSLSLVLSVLVLPGRAQESSLKTIKLFVQPTPMAHCPVVVSVAALEKQYPDFTPASCVVRTADARTLPSQADDLNGDGIPDEIAFETDWPGREQRMVTLEYGPESAVAPLRSNAASGAHALFSRKFEGLGWESDRVAWRLYDDKRNAIDLYGKNRPGLSLDDFAKPGVNYEKDSPFGRDIFWNGGAMGIGSVGAWVNGKLVRVADVTDRRSKILANGPVRAIAEMTYTGWLVGGRRIDLTSRFTIWAGQHWFLNDLTAANAEGVVFVTGLPAKPGITTLTSAPTLKGRQHRFLATWGSQVQRSGEESTRVNGDDLGLAVICSHGPLPPGADTLTDPDNTLIAVSMRHSGSVSTGRYVVLAAWDKEAADAQSVSESAPEARIPDAVHSADAWRRYIEALNPHVFTTATVEIAPLPADATAQPPLDSLSRAGILATMRRAADYQIAAQAATPQNNGWIRSTFYTGVMALYAATQDPKYLAQALRWAEASHWTPSPRNPTNADNQCCLQVYAELAMQQKDLNRLSPAIAAYDRQMASPVPGRVQWWWCDSLFMAPAGMARVSEATGDPRYARFMDSLWWDTADFLYDRTDHLFYRDKSFFHKRTAQSQKVFWARGNGWVMAGTARVLDALPPTDPDYPRFVKLHQEMAAKIVTLQGDDGLWRASLLDPAQYPLPETSGSGFFTYALAWGIHHHTLDRKTYLPVVEKAWRGLAGKVDAEGRLGYVQGVAGSPGPVQPDHTEEYAVGALLLAGNEMLQIMGGK